MIRRLLENILDLKSHRGIKKIKLKYFKKKLFIDKLNSKKT